MKFMDNVKKFFGFNNLKNAVILRRPRPGIPANQTKPPIIVKDKPIEYILNDPSTPNLVVSVPVPNIPENPKFSVQNYKGGGFSLGSVSAYKRRTSPAAVLNTDAVYSTSYFALMMDDPLSLISRFNRRS